MTHSARSIAHSADATATRALRKVAVIAAFAAIVVPGAGDAKMVRPVAYDGTWNVTFATRAGNCSSANNVPFSVVDTRVSSAGGGKVTGGISRAGVVSVNIRVGASHASGSGRLLGNSGSGRWSGTITGDRCSGSWQARRS